MKNKWMKVKKPRKMTPEQQAKRDADFARYAEYNRLNPFDLQPHGLGHSERTSKCKGAVGGG